MLPSRRWQRVGNSPRPVQIPWVPTVGQGVCGGGYCLLGGDDMGIALNDIFLLQDCLTMTASVVPLGTVGRDLSGGWMAVAYSAHPHIPHLNAVSQEQVKAAFNKFKSDLPSGNLT